MTSDPRAALSRLVAAFEMHLEAAARRRGESDPDVVAAYQVLSDAFEQYEDALYTTHDEVTPFVLFEEAEDSDAEDLEDDDEDDLDEDEDLEDDLDDDEDDLDEDDLDEDEDLEDDDDGLDEDPFDEQVDLEDDDGDDLDGDDEPDGTGAPSAATPR